MSFPEPLCKTVQGNCDIADSRHAGGFTMCVYLLRMREYFRWEQGLGFSDSLPHDEIGAWIQERERRWEGLDGKPYAPLEVDGREYDPFDAEALNEKLLPHGYVYSAGIGLRGATHFFLGRLEESGDGDRVYRVGEECARDLGAPVAMTLGETIFVRQDSLRRMLWERLQEWQWDRRDNALGAALACYPFEEDLEGALEEITRHETPNVVLHEVGEREVGRVLGTAWGERLEGLGRTHELGLRAARDHWADCTVLLPALLASGDRPSLLLYRAQLTGVRGEWFPLLRAGLDHWADTGDVAAASSAVERGERHWRALCLQLRDAEVQDLDGLLERAGL